MSREIVHFGFKGQERSIGDMAVSYNSACREINPRIEKEISERERRIQELLRRVSKVEEEEKHFDITFHTRPLSPPSKGITLEPA